MVIKERSIVDNMPLVVRCVVGFVMEGSVEGHGTETPNIKKSFGYALLEQRKARHIALNVKGFMNIYLITAKNFIIYEDVTKAEDSLTLSLVG